MNMEHPTNGTRIALEIESLTAIIQNLRKSDYEVVGPRVRDGAIGYHPIQSADDLPRGWADLQEPAHYRLEQTREPALFGYVAGVQSWKRYLHPPDVQLYEAQRTAEGGFRILPSNSPPPKYAFLGVRACELAALRALDAALITSTRNPDAVYAERRRSLFVIAVNCTRSGSTCFCASLQTGPRAEAGFDLALTELAHRNLFEVEVGSERGAALLSDIPTVALTAEDAAVADAMVEAAASRQTRQVKTKGLREILIQHFESPQWDRVSERCLTCANCTMACPTCFCTTVEDSSDVTQERAQRRRVWDSCFTQGFSYIHGGSVRTSSRSRYRQWLTHKFAYWQDQFGMTGCVGCGRCITWCPAGIDITEELAALRAAGETAATLQGEPQYANQQSA
jgi:sulfhydrogenase subunit beta (sulfur reductase)